MANCSGRLASDRGKKRQKKQSAAYVLPSTDDAMGLERVRNCSIQKHDGRVVITGTCKQTKRLHAVPMLQEEFDSWQSGYPLHCACPNLSRTEIKFLNTGVWEN